MPPVRRNPSAKPDKAKKSSSENEERAYIAASRRSDRSLDARMKSARRASKIHEQRTGRPLQITKDAVLNEEMYEEIIPLPVYYRQTITRPEFEHADFDKKFLAYLSGHLETRRGLEQAVAACWKGNHFEDGAPPWFPSISQQPTMPQQQHEEGHTVRNPYMPLRTTLARGSKNYRHEPYPLVTPNKKADSKNHIVSPALQVPYSNQQFLNFSYDSPLHAISCDKRRMSLPPDPNRGSLSILDGTSPTSSSHLSSSSSLTLQRSMLRPDRGYHHHGQPSQLHVTSSLIGYPAASSSWQKLTEPLSTEFPLDCQQPLDKDVNERIPSFPFALPQSFQEALSAYSYSYNPNARLNERESGNCAELT